LTYLCDPTTQKKRQIESASKDATNIETTFTKLRLAQVVPNTVTRCSSYAIMVTKSTALKTQSEPGTQRRKSTRQMQCL